MKGEAVRMPPWGDDDRPTISVWAIVYTGIFVVVLLAGIAYWQMRLGPDPSPAGPLTAIERVEKISQAWDAEPRTRTGHCPTVAALQKELPELRGVDRRERDYVAFLKGARCQ